MHKTWTFRSCGSELPVGFAFFFLLIFSIWHWEKVSLFLLKRFFIFSSTKLSFYLLSYEPNKQVKLEHFALFHSEIRDALPCHVHFCKWWSGFDFWSEKLKYFPFVPLIKHWFDWFPMHYSLKTIWHFSWSNYALRYSILPLMKHVPVD